MTNFFSFFKKILPSSEDKTADSSIANLSAVFLVGFVGAASVSFFMRWLLLPRTETSQPRLDANQQNQNNDRQDAIANALATLANIYYDLGQLRQRLNQEQLNELLMIAAERGTNFRRNEIAIPTTSEFNEHAQNTHFATVENSVEGSINALRIRYQGRDHQQALRDLLDYIHSLPDSHPHKSDALSCYQRIIDTGFRFEECLALVWLGAADQSALPPDIGATPIEAIIKMRKESIIEKLYWAQHAYAGISGAACPSGTRNLAISSLHRAHPDVLVLTASEAPMDAAISLISLWVREVFSLESLENQRAIYTSWDADEPTSAATKFKATLKSYVSVKLKTMFTSLLSQQQADDIINSLDYVNKPNWQDPALPTSNMTDNVMQGSRLR